MDRSESAEIIRDVVIYRKRSDVPADVVEAMDVALTIFGSEPRMEREKEARLTQLENTLRALVDALQSPTAPLHLDQATVKAFHEARALLSGDSRPTEEEPHA